jgi:hypothetical protein
MRVFRVVDPNTPMGKLWNTMRVILVCITLHLYSTRFPHGRGWAIRTLWPAVGYDLPDESGYTVV